MQPSLVYESQLDQVKRTYTFGLPYINGINDGVNRFAPKEPSLELPSRSIEQIETLDDDDVQEVVFDDKLMIRNYEKSSSGIFEAVTLTIQEPVKYEEKPKQQSSISPIEEGNDDDVSMRQLTLEEIVQFQKPFEDLGSEGSLLSLPMSSSSHPRNGVPWTMSQRLIHHQSRWINHGRRRPLPIKARPRIMHPRK
jgi:hypothetical protein